MDEKRSDLATARRPPVTVEGAEGGRHCAPKRLIAYRQGLLPAAERDAVQEHLSFCPRCTRLLLELRDFEAAAARGESGPELPREQAWDALVRRLPAKTPLGRPLAGPPRSAARRPLPRFAAAAAAALLLAALGFTLWSAVSIRQERQRLAHLERQLAQRDAALAALKRSLAEAQDRLAELARGESSEKAKLEQKVAELSAALAGLRQRPPAPERPERIAERSRSLEVTLAPRFALRGQRPEEGALRGGGVVNPVRTSAGRTNLRFDLAGHPVYGEYRLELLDRDGKLLWAGRRAAGSLLGDAGTTISVGGLGPGLYRLRIEGLVPDRSELLAEYLLDVEP